MKPIHNLPSLKPNRKNLRNHGTSAEGYLWQYLKQSKLNGRKFRRQHSIGHFIVDFYCVSEKIAVELDGEYHKFNEGYDQARDAFLAGEGITVLRFENKYVFENTDWVLEEICRHFGEK